MNYHIDIGHPAHVHLFKNLAWNLQEKGHHVFFSVRSGESESVLLKEYGFDYRIIGVKKTHMFRKFLGILSFTLKILTLSSKNQADLYISHGSMYAGYAAWFRRKPHIALEDTGNMEQLRLSLPVSNVILTPDILELPALKKRISYKGYHELTYLSPSIFNPDTNIKSLLGLNSGESYCLLRFVAWRATHDFGQTGFTDIEKYKLIEFLKKKHRVFISSESSIDSAFKEYEFPLKPHHLHDTIAGSEIVISEGATIAAEAGVLGIPSIYVSSIEHCYLIEDLESYGLVFRFRTPDGVISKVNQILDLENYKSEFQIRRMNMLGDKINVNAFLSWFIEHYPNSQLILEENPDFQNDFKEK